MRCVPNIIVLFAKLMESTKYSHIILTTPREDKSG